MQNLPKKFKFTKTIHQMLIYNKTLIIPSVRKIFASNMSRSIAANNRTSVKYMQYI